MHARLRSCSFGTLLGLSRAAFVLGLVVGIAFVLALRDAKAEAGSALLGFGDELMHWAGTSVHGKPRQLTLNGLDFHLVTLSTSLPVKDTLERLHGLCRERGGIQAPEAALRAPRDRNGLASGLVDATISTVAESEGVIACLDTAGPLGLQELAHRLERVAQTGDVSELGHLRYMLARRERDVTTALVLWTEGSAPLLRAFPATGDAPGVDPADCRRPQGSRRLLSAAEHGAPYSVTIYSVDDIDPNRLDAWYRQALGNAGWHLQGSPGKTTLIAERGDRRLMIHLERGAAGATTAAVLELS